MSIFFNNSFGLKNNIENKPAEGKPAISGKLSNLPQYISALKEGSIFKGEILDVRNTAVKILLSSNDILNARTDGSVQLNIGDILDFRVESNNGLNMLVKAVSTGNTNGGLNMLMSALNSAEVPVNERNLALVKELVSNGQPIDKNTIKTLVSNLNSFTELDTDTAVNMYKHDIPITQENITQFNKYITSNNKLMDNYNSMTNDIVNTLVDFSNTNSQGDVIQLANNILQAITGDESVDVRQLLSDGQQMTDNVFVEGEVSGNNPDNNMTNTETTPPNTDSQALVGNKTIITEALNNIENAVNGDTQLNANALQAPVQDLFSNESFKEALSKLVKESLFIDKEVLDKPENELKAELEKYYKDVQNKTERLLNVLENAGLEKSALQENASSIKSNMNFMNDLNNMALYMQIPVKFNENEAHGELYVLNRNRNKQKENDVLTAFLHLDMEHLGATDVNIRLENDKLTTKFNLDDVISQDIVEEHLHELKKRLEEKGYSATLLVEEVKTDNEDVSPSPFEQVLMLEEPKNFIKRYTFDVRA